MIEIIKEKCTGCGACVESCAFGAMEMRDSIPDINESCVFCGACVDACPENALVLNIKQVKKDFSDYSGIWVVGELDPVTERLRRVTLELLCEAGRLAAIRKQKVVAVLLADRIPQRDLDQISQTGCDEVIQVLSPSLKQYNTDFYTGSIVSLVRERKPEIVLFPATENGRDMAPRIACRLQTGLTADCTGLDIDGDGNLVQIRPTYGGNIMASIITPNARPQMASIRPNVMQVSEANSKDMVVKIIEPDTASFVTSVILDSIRQKDEVFRDVGEAQVIIAGGYGLKSAEDFQLLHKIASRLNIAVGASRKAVDEGFAPQEIQIGQTGKTIAPDLYIACGISGALQHTIGIKNARRIIAINSDPAAPIFNMSDIAVVGDAKNVLLALLDKIESMETQSITG